MKKKSKKQTEKPQERNPVVCTDWPGMQGDKIVEWINGLPYTERMLIEREKRLLAEEQQQP